MRAEGGEQRQCEGGDGCARVWCEKRARCSGPKRSWPWSSSLRVRGSTAGPQTDNTARAERVRQMQIASFVLSWR